MADKPKENGVPVVDRAQPVSHGGKEKRTEEKPANSPRRGAISGPSLGEPPRQGQPGFEALEVQACEHLRQLRELEANYSAPQREEELRKLMEQLDNKNRAHARNDPGRANEAPVKKEPQWNGKWGSGYRFGG